MVHDFPDKKLGKAIPYGVYDLANNEGWVSVGIDHDTAEFAVASVRRWWHTMGARRFPRATKLLITADGGGSNSSRNRLWKVVLQRLADELNLSLQVCHFPPGTSKWNKIEHRLFCFITKNWRGRPLITYKTVVNLIASTTTKTGLRVKAAIDENNYQTGIKVSDEQLARVNITHADFHGEWNYSISPTDQFDQVIFSLVLRIVFGWTRQIEELVLVDRPCNRALPPGQHQFAVITEHIFFPSILGHVGFSPRI